ncbi:MAG: MacB-like periplasmic core domain protein [Gemmatimonadetes bacterium]|nr:MacB-like periplasmic core domain protein [Gemmatimonadota bacterium]
MTRLELSIAWRYLRSRRGSRLLSLISVIAIGGVIVGVGALIVITGVMNGLQHDLREKILIASPDVRVLTYGDDMTMARWDTLVPVVLKDPGVVAASPFVHTQAGISAGHNYAEGVFVMGILPQGIEKPEVTSIRRTATAGDFSFSTTDGKHRGAVLGNRLARRLGVVPGVDSVRLISLGAGKMSAVTGTFVPNTMSFEVTGIFETGMYEYDNSYVILSLESAQQLAQLGNSVTGLQVRTPTRGDAGPVGLRLAEKLPFPYRTEDWQQQNSSLFQALQLEKLGMSFILFLIVVVAAFNIVSTLTMVVTDKTREIGILRAMGMTSRSIRRIFFVQGVVIGVVGTAAGVAVGIGAATAIDRYRLIPLDATVYFIDHLPVYTQPLDVAVTVAASLLIAALATMYPARQASRLFPVEAIRHE